MSVVVVMEPKVPAKPRPLRDFDKFVAAADRVVAYLDKVTRWISEVDEAEESGEPRSESRLARANRMADEAWAKVQSDLAKVKEGFEVYGGDDLYDDPYGDSSIKRHVVADKVSMLLGSFPNAAPHAPKVYTPMLIEELIAHCKSAVVLEAACRTIRRTMTFAPTIAEVLKVYDAEAVRWDDRIGCEYDAEEWHRALKAGLAALASRPDTPADIAAAKEAASAP